MIGQTITLLRKDLLLEFRDRESVPAMALLAAATLVVFHFALGQRSISGELASGALWVTLLFASMLGISRLFVAEQEDGGFDAVLLAPVERTAILLAKATALLIFLVIVELIAVPMFGVLLLGVPLGPAIPGLIGVLLLADICIAIVGALVSALAIQTRIRELLVPILALPLLLPVVIAGSRASGQLFQPGGPAAVAGRWPLMLALYGVVFGLLSFALYDYLLDD
ncbi:MAG: heme exporter protein CcmB [Solirubrobacterales bacterium]|nr:heme exporter protein CcmB [Solirubrobacterales bacterium]